MLQKKESKVKKSSKFTPKWQSKTVEMNRTDAKVSVEFNLWTGWTPPVEFNLWTSWTYGFDARCFLHTAPLPPRLAHFQHFSQCQLVSEECFSEGVRPASLICNIISRSALAKLHLVACCRSRVTIASVFSADSCCESQQSFGFGGHCDRSCELKISNVFFSVWSRLQIES